MLWWWSWCGLCCPCLGFPLVRELQRALRAFPPRSLAVGGCAHTTCRHHTFYAGRRQFLWRCICRRLFNLRALWDLVWHQATTRQLFRIGDGASPSLCSHMCDVDGSLAAVPLQAPSLDGSGIWLLLLPLDTIHSLPAFLIGRLPFPHIIPSALYHPTFHFLVLLVHFCGCSLTFYTLPCFSSPISFFVKLHDPLSNPPPPVCFLSPWIHHTLYFSRQQWVLVFNTRLYMGGVQGVLGATYTPTGSLVHILVFLFTHALYVSERVSVWCHQVTIYDFLSITWTAHLLVSSHSFPLRVLHDFHAIFHFFYFSYDLVHFTHLHLFFLFSLFNTHHSPL